MESSARVGPKTHIGPKILINRRLVADNDGYSPAVTANSRRGCQPVGCHRGCILLGPLAWPVAIVAAYVAVWRAKGSGDGAGKRGSGVLGACFVVSIFALPSLLVFALVLII